jgi:hypothetical protein
VCGVSATTLAAPRTRRAVRLTTPLRLRLWTSSVVAAALIVLVAASVGMARLQSQIETVGADAAPQAATASDLYFALSDLDAQVARLILIDEADNLSSSELDALRTYQQRSAQINTDVAAALGAATTDADRAALRQLTDQLALYRQLAWQAIAVEREQPPQPPGAPPAAALGYYTHAANVMRAELLPTAKGLRESSQARLTRVYAAQRQTAVWSVVLLVVFGTGLVGLLGLLQRRLARHYRRLINPGLLLATLATVVLVVAACVVFLDETDRLRAAQADDFGPYLALTQAQAVSYDAGADTTRYLLAGNLASLDQDFHAKSACLVGGGGCGAGGDVLAGGLAALAGGPRAGDLADRWAAYQRDHERIVRLAGSGQVAAAVDALTGIRRGDAAFDFFYFDAALSTVVAERRQAFDTALSGARAEVWGWTWIPVLVMGVAILLILAGMRPRLAEYR